jgi:hypothetical protein
VPFLGAGVNLAGRTRNTEWSERPHDLPDAWELARWLAEKARFRGEEVDLLRIAQFIETTLGDGELYHHLRRVFLRESTPTRLHELLATLPGRLRAAKEQHPELNIEKPYLLVVTTNYDDTLERAFAQAGEPYDVVTYMAKGDCAGCFDHLPTGEAKPHTIRVPNEYAGVCLDDCNVILKLHGAIDRDDEEHDSFVITEDDYIDYLATTDPAGMLPVSIAAKLKLSHLLFLGYGLRDWNLRVILRRLWGARKLNFRSWAVQLDPDEVETELWKRRDVDIHDADLAAYTELLDAQLALHLREPPSLDEDRPAA